MLTYLTVFSDATWPQGLKQYVGGSESIYKLNSHPICNFTNGPTLINKTYLLDSIIIGARAVSIPHFQFRLFSQQNILILFQFNYLGISKSSTGIVAIETAQITNYQILNCYCIKNTSNITMERFFQLISNIRLEITKWIIFKLIKRPKNSISSSSHVNASHVKHYVTLLAPINQRQG